jgi:hypothetical protein
MIGYPLTCDINTLQQMESRYQLELTEDPANLELRLDLAWCLFMHALHEAGRESLLPSLAGDDRDGDRADMFREIGLFDQKAYRLLKGCLKETFTVLQLSPNTPEEVAKLHALIRLAGANQAFLEAEDEAMKILARLGRDMAVVQPPNN